MHEASFELIEIPHVRQLGKNSATSDGRRRARPLLHEGARGDVRDHQRRLGLSPLVIASCARTTRWSSASVSQSSTSDPLIANCDEFISLRRSRARAEGGGGSVAAGRPAPRRRPARVARRRRRPPTTPDRGSAAGAEAPAAPESKIPTETSAATRRARISCLSKPSMR